MGKPREDSFRRSRTLSSSWKQPSAGITHGIIWILFTFPFYDLSYAQKEIHSVLHQNQHRKNDYFQEKKGPINTEISISTDIDETWPVYGYLQKSFLVFHNEEAMNEAA